jgi:hypothetical protein
MPRKIAWVRTDVYYDPNVSLDETLREVLAIEWPTPSDEMQLFDFQETLRVCTREEFIEYVTQFPPSPALLWFLLSRFQEATSDRAAKGGAKRAAKFAVLRDSVLTTWEEQRNKWKSRAQFAVTMAEANGQRVTPRQIEKWIRDCEKARATTR